MTLLTFRLIFLAGIFSLVLAPGLARAAAHFGVLDHPGSAPHKRHNRPVPLSGGWAIAVTVFLLALIDGLFVESEEVAAVLLASLIVFFWGIWDDARGLSAPLKLVGQVVPSLILMGVGIYVRLFDPPFEWLNWGITLVWLVGITNAYNFVDSMDGLATGLAGVAAAFFMLVTFDSDQLSLSLLSAILLGSCIGVFFYNSRPAHFFLGDAGAQWLGFVLAALAIVYDPVGFLRTQSWFIPVLLVGVPVFDTTLVVVSRLRRGLPIYLARADHTYHRLVAFGMHSNRAVLLMHMIALLLGCLAFITLSLPPLLANSIYFFCMLSGGLAITLMDSKKRWFD